jgi:threo-3-hydroxy-L-aspartate ammonia-lyase
VTSVLIPVSGGGLSAGIATAIKTLAPDARVIGVEPELAADARESLATGEIVHWDSSLTTRTMADGLRVEHLGRLPFLHLRRYMDEIVTVTENQMLDAIRRLASGARLVAEPSGAAAMAAHLSGAAAQPDGDDRRVVVISGGNLDPLRFAEILSG